MTELLNKLLPIDTLQSQLENLTLGIGEKKNNNADKGAAIEKINQILHQIMFGDDCETDNKSSEIIIDKRLLTRGVDGKMPNPNYNKPMIG
jgi:hypothetical protein